MVLVRWLRPADLIELYDRIGGATLFGGGWRLLPMSEWREQDAAVVIGSLADGRGLAMVNEWRVRQIHWTLVGEAPVERAEDVPLYGTSLTLLLDAALDTGGDISHLQTGWLSDLDL